MLDLFGSPLPPAPPPRPMARPAPSASAFSPEILAKLARLHNRRTLYEIEIVRPDGRRALLCYSAEKGKSAIMAAIDRRGEAVLRFIGNGSGVLMEGQKGQNEVHIGVNIVRPSGRTQRDAIIEGELPYVAAKES